MKVVLDTNVLIGFFRNAALMYEFTARVDRPLLFISSIVAMELFAGCRTRQQNSAVVEFLKPFEKANRIIVPDHGGIIEAGRTLARLGNDGIAAAHLRLLRNDVLIAVTAARAGAVVVTANARDFARIQKHTPVQWMRPL